MLWHKNGTVSFSNKLRMIFIPFLFFLISREGSLLPEGIVVHGREIEGSDQWELVGENDTIAAGLHVRMDLSTGEKWVKKLSSSLPDDDDESNENFVEKSISGVGGDSKSEVSMSNNLSSSKVATTSVSIDSSGQVTALIQKEDEDEENTADDSIRQEPKYNFEMMHRTLSKLPDSEKERIGGLPEPPSVTDYESHNVKDYEMLRKKFENRMRKIWEQRQEELQRIQEEMVADLPKILQQWIGVIQEYLNDPTHHLRQIINDNKKHGDSSDEYQDNNNHNLITILQELEFQLSDIDMARDFHTLGGWPLLVSLLHNKVHKQPPLLLGKTQLTPLNSTIQSNDSIDDIDIILTDQEYTVINTIQENAAWAIGTAVKNTMEFSPYTVEEVPIITADIKLITTPLDLLLSQLKDTAVEILIDENSDYYVNSNSKLYQSAMKKFHKIVYALGSFVRSNRFAQAKLCLPLTTNKNIVAGTKELESVTGAQIIIDVLKGINDKIFTVSNNASSPPNGGNNNKHYYKIMTRIVMLIDDIITNIKLHPQHDKDEKMIIDSFSTGTTVTGNTNESYCDVLLSSFSNISDDHKIISLQQTALRTMNTMAPYCFDKTDEKFQKNKKNWNMTFSQIKTQWQQILKDDKETLDEQSELLQNILKQLL